jgi:hypothetical protein
MSFSRSVGFAVLTNLLSLACGGAASAPAGAGGRQPAPFGSAAGTEKAANQSVSAGRAQWSPRTGREFNPLETLHLDAEIIEREPRPSVVLGENAVGLVTAGARFIASGGTVRRVDVKAAPVLLGVVTIPGIGFGFLAKNSMYFAQQFDGPLVTLAAADSGLTSFKAVARLGQLNFADESVRFVELATGAPAANLPANIVALYPHSNGTLLGIAVTKGKQPKGAFWFSSDQKTWAHVGSPKGPSGGVYNDADGFFLPFLTNGDIQSYHVGRNGRLITLPITGNQAREKMSEIMTSTPQPEPRLESLTALLTDHWARLSPDSDVWFTEKGHQLYVRRGAQTKALGDPFEDNARLCEAYALEGQAFIQCVEMSADARSLVYRVNLDTGAHTMDQEVAIPHVYHRYAQSYPRPIVLPNECDSRERSKGRGVCVRAKDGRYVSFIVPPETTDATVTPGEFLAFRKLSNGGLELTRVGTSERAEFSAQSIAKIQALVDPRTRTNPEVPEFDFRGSLRTQHGVRRFYTRSETLPALAAQVSHAIDYPLAGGEPTLTTVPGTLLFAGEKALRVNDGKMYESVDGWETWREVAPPPIGVPDLKGASCTQFGCMTQTWIRVGWDQ